MKSLQDQSNFPSDPGRRLACQKFVSALTVSWVSEQVWAQGDPGTWPSKPITFIVPYAAGGSSDTRARQLAQKLSSYLGKAIVVENKPGGGGNIGTDAIAKAIPDGHTIGWGNFAPMAVNKALMAKVPFDPATDVVPVALVEKGPIVLAVGTTNSRYRFNTFQDLLAFARANPGKLSFGSAGAGSSYHLAGELLNDAAKVDIIHVPYKGGGPAVTDLIGGQLDMIYDMLPSTMPYLKSTPPRMRLLAVGSDKRLPQIPDVPTFSELGLPALEMSNWFGVIVPRGIHPAIVDKLNKAMNRALKEPDLVERITGPGNIVGGGSPEAFAAFIASESARWGKLVKEKRITPE